MWRESRRRVNSLHRLRCERTQRERRRSLICERGITPIDRVRRPTVMVVVARGEVGVPTGLPTVTVEPPGSSVSFFTTIHSLLFILSSSFSLSHDGRRLPAECASGVPLFSAHCAGVMELCEKATDPQSRMTNEEFRFMLLKLASFFQLKSEGASVSTP